MRIGLIDVDSHNFPNLCLMKLSAYHQQQGDQVEWYNSDYHYDIVYQTAGCSGAYHAGLFPVWDHKYSIRIFDARLPSALRVLHCWR